MSSEAAAASGQWRESYFNASDGTQLFHASLVPENARAAVLIIHGYDDHCLRYRHVMDALAAAGLAAHGFDYRGHGHAGGRRGFTSKFSEYTSDLSSFIARVRAQAGGVPLFLLAHSHGALVAGTLLVSEQRPADVAGVVFSSPYYELSIAPSAFQLLQAKVVGRVIPFLPIKSPLNSGMLTHDQAMQQAADADPFKHRVVTPRWFTVSNAAQAALLEHAREFTYPMLMLLGKDDKIAAPHGGEQFYESAGSKDKRLIVYEGMLHEVLNEVDRAKPIHEIISWVQAHLAPKAFAA